MERKTGRLTLFGLVLACAGAAAGADLEPPADGVDAAPILQKLVDDPSVRLIALAKGDWTVGETIRLRGRRDLEIVLRDGARIIAAKGKFRKQNEEMFYMDLGTRNVTIRGEGNATLEMRLRDYQDPANGYSFSEWRHIIVTYDTADITVRNLTFLRAGGDGISVHGTDGLTVEDCRFVDNNRLGLGVVSGRNITVRRCWFEANNGTPPKAGIDLEPNVRGECLENILVEECTFKDHVGAGFSLLTQQLTAQSAPVTVTLRNCRSVGNQYEGFRIAASGETSPVCGLVTLENCAAEGNVSADYGFYYRAKEGLRVVTNNCRFGTVKSSDWVKPEGVAPLKLLGLRPLRPDAKGRGSTGWMRWTNTFLQCVPGAGTYTVRFNVRPLDPGEPAVTVDTYDWRGTPLKTFKVGREGCDYTFTANSQNCISFVARATVTALVSMESDIPGAAVRADRFVRMCMPDSRRTYAFGVPADCEEPRVEIRAEEPCAAALYDASGREVASVDCAKNECRMLAAKRAKTSADEVWTFRMTKVEEDAQFRICAPCPPVAELVGDTRPDLR